MHKHQGYFLLDCEFRTFLFMTLMHFSLRVDPSEHKTGIKFFFPSFDFCVMAILSFLPYKLESLVKVETTKQNMFEKRAAG